MDKKYKLFISHSWTYGDAYEKIVSMLNREGINFSNHSVPKSNPIHTNGTDKQLMQKLEVHVVS